MAVYLVNGAFALAVVPVLALLPKSVFRSSRHAGVLPSTQDDASATSARPQAKRGYRAVLADGVVRRYLVTMTVLMLAGYGALNTGFVGFATSVAKAGPGTIAAAYAANTMFIVVAQPLALRVVSRTRRTTALKLVAAAFGTCWVVLACAGLAPGSSVSRALVIACLVVFAAGEVLPEPSRRPARERPGTAGASRTLFRRFCHVCHRCQRREPGAFRGSDRCRPGNLPARFLRRLLRRSRLRCRVVAPGAQAITGQRSARPVAIAGEVAGTQAEKA